jgi:hypothetical protein
LRCNSFSEGLIRVIRHIVVFSIDEGRDAALEQLIEDVHRLPAEIAEISAIACGRPLNATAFDAALTVDVPDEAALAAYREHPAHQPVLQRLREIASQLVVADIAV